MAAITAALVKELRQSTGAGMMDCKKALGETDGDIEAAVDWLRKKGLSAAAKKSGRAATEGLVAISGSGNTAAMVEINAETDFVARNDGFQSMVKAIADIALGTGDDADALNAASFPGTKRTVAEEITHQIATIGENMAFRRVRRLSVSAGVVSGYIHNALAPGLGKIGVLVALESDGDAAKLDAFGKQLAMHIAATGPLALDHDSLDAATVEHEKKILADQARESGKPEEIIEKMIEGRIRKYYQEVCLLDQTYVIDGESKVSKAVEIAAKDIGSPIKVVAFQRFELGEGLEKKQEDFAAEVAAAVSG